MAVGIAERLNDPEEQRQASMENELAKLRVAIPGIIQSFDATRQTASVQPAITENIKIGDAETQAISLPLLTDVPVVFPRGGGYSITFPVKAGDECLLIFSDVCIDGWWQSGGVQGQMDHRRHDLSDACAILGISSVPRAVSGCSTDALQIRADEGGTLIELGAAGITLKAAEIKVDGNLNVTGNLMVGGTSNV